MGKLTQQTTVLNESGRLRDLLYECEKSLVRIDPETARYLMVSAEQAHRLLEQLDVEGVDLRAEIARMEAIDERILRRARIIVRALGGREAFVSFRQKSVTGESLRFWSLDNELDRARKRLYQQLVTTVAVIAIILLAGYMARGSLFPPNPVGDAEADAEKALALNKPADAMTAIDVGLTIVPTSTDLLFWKGILLDRAGESISATVVYSQAYSLYPSEFNFYIDRALILVRLGEYNRVISDTNTAIAINPNAAEAYYLRASGYEGIGDRAQAISDLSLCAQLAQSAGNDTLVATAKIRLGTLMQQY